MRSYAIKFLTAQANYHFIQLIWIEFDVISTSPLGDVAEFVGNK